LPPLLLRQTGAAHPTRGKQNQEKPRKNKTMKYFTVQANCKHVDTRYSLRHNGEEWTEKMIDSETTFETIKDAEEFAASESESFEVRNEMVIIEHEEEEE